MENLPSSINVLSFLLCTCGSLYSPHCDELGLPSSVSRPHRSLRLRKQPLAIHFNRSNVIVSWCVIIISLILGQYRATASSQQSVIVIPCINHNCVYLWCKSKCVHILGYNSLLRPICTYVFSSLKDFLSFKHK